jgi:hypothetical protein
VKSILTISTFASAIGFCFFIGMWPLSYYLDLSKHLMDAKITSSDCIALPKDFKMGFENGAIWLYSGAMPYRGGIISVADKHSTRVVHGWDWRHFGFTHVEYLNSSLPDERMCDLPGIYFRRFVWPGSPPWTTLRVTLCYPILLSAALPILWVFRHGRKAFKI